MSMVCVCVCVLVTQSCSALCKPMDSSWSGSCVHGILQTCHSLLQGILPTLDQTRVSCIAGRFFTIWATREAYRSNKGQDDTFPIYLLSYGFCIGNFYSLECYFLYGSSEHRILLLLLRSQIKCYLLKEVFPTTHLKYPWVLLITFIIHNSLLHILNDHFLI